MKKIKPPTDEKMISILKKENHKLSATLSEYMKTLEWRMTQLKELRKENKKLQDHVKELTA